MINNSIRPLYIKQEILESDGGGEVVDMDQDDEDILLDNVVMGGTAEGVTVSESGSSESEDKEEEDEEMEETPEDPIVAVRNLYEREEGLARGGTGQKEEVPVPVIKPVLDNRYAVRGLRKKTGHGKDWEESGVVGEMERASFLTPEDDRILFNSNQFSLDKKKNISRSFDSDGICVTCPSGPHSALAGKEGFLSSRPEFLSGGSGG
jgi:hypothetical protein